MEELYNQIIKHEKKQAVTTNIISTVSLLIGITGLLTGITYKMWLIVGIAVFINIFAITDLLITNISLKQTIDKIHKNHPSLKEGHIKSIEEKNILAEDNYTIEYVLNPVTNHEFNVGDKVFFISINEFFGMKCKQKRFIFLNNKMV